MKAKELLSFVIDLNLSNMCHEVHTPKVTNAEDCGHIWVKWYYDYLHVEGLCVNEVCVLDEDSDYVAVYVHEEDTWFKPELDLLNVCYTIDRLRCRRIYLIKVE